MRSSFDYSRSFHCIIIVDQIISVLFIACEIVTVRSMSSSHDGERILTNRCTNRCLFLLLLLLRLFFAMTDNWSSHHTFVRFMSKASRWPLRRHLMFRWGSLSGSYSSHFIFSCLIFCLFCPSVSLSLSFDVSHVQQTTRSIDISQENESCVTPHIHLSNYLAFWPSVHVRIQWVHLVLWPSLTLTCIQPLAKGN